MPWNSYVRITHSATDEIRKARSSLVPKKSELDLLLTVNLVRKTERGKLSLTKHAITIEWLKLEDKFALRRCLWTHVR